MAVGRNARHAARFSLCVSAAAARFSRSRCARGWPTCSAARMLVDGEDPGGLGVQELSPGRACAAGSRLDARGTQDLPDGGWRDGHTEFRRFTVDPAISHSGSSFARRTTRRAMLGTVGGRPGLRRLLVSYLLAASLRCQVSSVAGQPTMTASNLLATAQVSHSIEYSSGTGPGLRRPVPRCGCRAAGVRDSLRQEGRTSAPVIRRLARGLGSLLLAADRVPPSRRRAQGGSASSQRRPWRMGTGCRWRIHRTRSAQTRHIRVTRSAVPAAGTCPCRGMERRRSAGREQA